MAIAEVFPFAAIDGSWRYPAWIRGLRRTNGVYLFRDRRDGEIAYIGESHSDRLYSTLTRHFQAWTDKYDTAGVTYARHEVDVAVIVVPAEHAVYLQNELICALIPRDNRLQCAQLFGPDDAPHDNADTDDPADADDTDDPGTYDAGAYDDAIDDDIIDDDDHDPADRGPPAGYDYDIDLLIEGIDHRFDQDIEHQLDEVPF